MIQRKPTNLPASSPGEAGAQQPRASCKPQIQMAESAYRDILRSIASRPPETGGILLGPVGSNDITDFYFDVTARTTAVTYSPDHVTLNQKMKSEWLPSGLDMKGLTHSHPGRLDWLTEGDIAYIKRLLITNSDMSQFAAPIVIPGEFRLRPIVVLRDQPDRPLEARLILF